MADESASKLTEIARTTATRGTIFSVFVAVGTNSPFVGPVR